MTKIYEQHDAAFRNVSAYVVMNDGERVATVALKFPADGAGRLYAYVHWLGCEMTRGFAGGGGYDKRTAAVVDAANKCDRKSVRAPSDDDGIRAFYNALDIHDGYSWDRKLIDAGFTVLQAV